MLPAVLKPVNRHMLIVPHIEEKGEQHSGVLLPDNYKPQEERYIVATVVDVASDCASQFQKLRRGTFSERSIVVDRSMIEEVQVKGKVNHLILENYVVGLLRGHNED
jgi:co-chaperonin GroES (HSP10)